MIAGLTLALGGAALMGAAPIQRTCQRRRYDRDQLEGVGAGLAAAFAAPSGDDFCADLLGRLSDPEPPAPAYPSTSDI